MNEIATIVVIVVVVGVFVLAILLLGYWKFRQRAIEFEKSKIMIPPAADHRPPSVRVIEERAQTFRRRSFDAQAPPGATSQVSPRPTAMPQSFVAVDPLSDIPTKIAEGDNGVYQFSSA